MRRGFGRILAYWRAERRTIRQGFVALVFADLGSLVAGIALGSITGTLDAFPGLLVLIPAAIGMRGNIFGAMGSRLGTSIHSGLFEPSPKRGGILHQNIYAATVLTFLISLVLAILAKTMSVAFGEKSISILDFMVISIVGGVLSSLIVGGMAVSLSQRAYARGWDLDSVAAPLITAAGDMVTIPSLFLATFLTRIAGFTVAIAWILVAVTVYLTVRSIFVDLPAAKRILRESIPVLAIAGAVDILAGLVVESRIERFLVFPALLVLIPPFLESAGALGGILASRLGSKLHLGVISPRGRPEAVAWLDATIIFVFAVRSFIIIGLTASLASAILGLASPGVLKMVGVSLTAGLIATIMATVVAYYAAVATYRLGWDPDNHGIPMITSSMDFLGVLSVIIGLVALGVG